MTIVPLESIQYDDYPEIRVNEHERTEMPFRYVKDANGQPIMPPVCSMYRPLYLYGVQNADYCSQGMVDLIKKDADKGVDDLF